MDLDFSALTGSGVRVCIIDSGFFPGHEVENVRESVGITQEGAHFSVTREDWIDEVGHGTAVAGVVSMIAPEADLHTVKVFKHDLVSDVRSLTKAIEWCIRHDINIVNLSLGTDDTDALGSLREVCNRAASNGLLVVAAMPNHGRVGYPCVFPSVFGVAGGKVRGKYGFYYNSHEEVQFVARGDAQRLNWLDGKRVFIGGNSFAAPHITGILALILQKHPDIPRRSLDRILAAHSATTTPPPIGRREMFSAQSFGNTVANVTLRSLLLQADTSWIDKAVLYPFAKEMHSLVRFRDLLRFSVVGVADVKGRITTGLAAGQVVGGDVDMPVTTKLKSVLESGDALILGHLEVINRLRRRDCYAETLRMAHSLGKNVYSFSHAWSEQLRREFADSGLRLISPLLDLADYKRITTTFNGLAKSREPIVGVFGTSPNQGKFTTQLVIRQEMQSRGYDVGQVGTEPHGWLFDFDFTFPNGYAANANIHIPMDLHINLIQSVMAGVELEDPDLIVVGGQSGLIPYSYSRKSSAYTIPSIILLMATQPDCVVLQVNPNDDERLVRDAIQVVSALGKSVTILLTFRSVAHVPARVVGRRVIGESKLSQAECNALRLKLQNTFGVPALDVLSEDGRLILGNILEEFFAE